MQKYTGFPRVILDVQKNPLVSDDPEVRAAPNELQAICGADDRDGVIVG
jgi:hypothetical protein